MNVIEYHRPNKASLQWDYFLDDMRYGFNLESLVNDYNRYSKMSQKEFEDNLPRILHFAVFVAFYKNLNSVETISDNGILHTLIHLLQFREELNRKGSLYRLTYQRARTRFKILEITLKD